MRQRKLQNFKLMSHMCGNATYNEENIIVRDNCHVTGKYRGSAHSPCNRSFRLTKLIPVVFHNLRGYDSHLIMQEIGKFDEEVNVVANNMEKCMSFSLGKQLIFIDSLQQFMSSNLSALADNLPKEQFHHMMKQWGEGNSSY